MNNPRLTKTAVEQISKCKKIYFVVQAKETFVKVECEDMANFLLASDGNKIQVYDRKKFMRSIKRIRNDIIILEI